MQQRYRYNPARGGHAGGHLREPFIDWADGPQDEGSVDIDERTRRPLKWLVGQLWNCTDTMPSYTCEALDLLHGSTFAQGVRSLPKSLTEGAE